MSIVQLRNKLLHLFNVLHSRLSLAILRCFFTFFFFLCRCSGYVLLKGVNTYRLRPIYVEQCLFFVFLFTLKPHKCTL